MPPHSNEHPHRLDNGANTPLLAAATQCDLKGVQRGLLSIEDVAPLLAADFETGSTALHRACECTDDQHISRSWACLTGGEAINRHVA